MRLLINRMDSPPTEPTQPTTKKAETNDWVVLRYKKELNQWIKEMTLYKKDKSKVFAVIKGQCSLAMHNKLVSLFDYKMLEDNDDVTGLLKKIKDLTSTTESTQHEYWTLSGCIKWP